jgi:acyl-CoA synthetase (AMP-forming)/AMP-acid ligase II
MEATAIGIPHAKRGEAVKVFVVLKEGQTATAEELLKYCEDKLAKYKWPTEIEFREGPAQNQCRQGSQKRPQGHGAEKKTISDTIVLLMALKQH